MNKLYSMYINNEFNTHRIVFKTIHNPVGVKIKNSHANNKHPLNTTLNNIDIGGIRFR